MRPRYRSLGLLAVIGGMLGSLAQKVNRFGFPTVELRDLRFAPPHQHEPRGKRNGDRNRHGKPKRKRVRVSSRASHHFAAFQKRERSRRRRGVLA